MVSAGAAPAQTLLLRAVAAGRDEQHIGPQLLQLLGDEALHAVAHGQQQHHRGDADDDAQHGQQRAQAVRQHRTERLDHDL